MKVKPVILIFIRNFKIFTDVFPKRIKVVLRCELYAVLAVLLGTTLELVGYSLWLTVGTIVCIWVNEAPKPLVQGRHFSWFDVGRNELGIAIGMVIVIILFMKFVEKITNV